MDPITAATHKWAAKQIKQPVENIKSVEFGVDGGGCETCGLGPEVVVEVCLHRGWSEQFDIDSLTDIVRDISALVRPEPPEPSWGRP